MNWFKKYWKTATKIIISAAAIYFVFSKIDGKEVWELVKQSDWIWFIPALLFFVLSQTISSFRLNRFFRAIEVFISQKANFRLYLLGMFYNLFLPGGVGGDGYKIYLLNKQFDTGYKKLFWAILFDRIIGLIALVIIACVLALFIFTKWWILFLAIFIPIFSLFTIHYTLKRFYHYLKKVLTPALLLSFLVQLCQLTSAIFILLALGLYDFSTLESQLSNPNSQLTTHNYLFLFLLSSIAAAVPFTIGGIGARELTLLYGAQFLGLQTDIAVSLSLLFFIITAIVSLTGLTYSFNTRKTYED